LRPLCDWQAVSLRDRQWRPDVERLVERLRELVPQPAKDTLERILDALQRDQDHYFELLDRSPGRALSVALATLRKLNRVCPAYPQDTRLQLIRGYTHKNAAMAQQRLGRDGEAQQALAQAWRTFSTAAQERPKDASAWNGMGSVALLRGQPKQALRCIDKALSLVPRYPAALHDRELALAALQRR
jgi:tetratricopeptide (TPR) repeat protein